MCAKPACIPALCPLLHAWSHWLDLDMLSSLWLALLVCCLLPGFGFGTKAPLGGLKNELRAYSAWTATPTGAAAVAAAAEHPSMITARRDAALTAETQPRREHALQDQCVVQAEAKTGPDSQSETPSPPGSTGLAQPTRHITFGARGTQHGGNLAQRKNRR